MRAALVLLALGVVTTLLAPGAAADDAGLHATGHVGSAQPGPSVMVAVGTGYGFTEEIQDTGDAHHRIGGTAAIAITPAPWLELGGELRGRYDKHTGDMPDDGFVGDPRLWARLTKGVGGGRWLALRLGVWLPGADAPSIESEAITLEAAALFTMASARGSFTFTAGYRRDRSAYSVDAVALSPNDRIGLGLSDADAVLLGARIDRSLGRGRWSAIGEVSADLLVGDDAPDGLMQSPIRVAAGVRRALDTNVALEGLVEAAASSRPDADDDTLIAIEPRLAATIGLVWRPRPPAPPVRVHTRTALTPPHEDVPPPPPPPTTGALHGRILDPEGAPLPGATVHAGERTATTGDDGTFTLADLPPGDVELTIERPGHQPLTRTATVTAGGDLALDLSLARVKLPSVIRGVIRNYSGQGLPAKVRIEPLGVEVTAAADGTFSVEVPAGTYTLVISHPGYEPQEKKNVAVEDEEVASRNVELRKARR